MRIKAGISSKTKPASSLLNWPRPKLNELTFVAYQGQANFNVINYAWLRSRILHTTHWLLYERPCDSLAAAFWTTQ
jgi:hypothetical protein